MFRMSNNISLHLIIQHNSILGVSLGGLPPTRFLIMNVIKVLIQPNSLSIFNESEKI